MFGFFFNKKRDEVRQFLAGRINQNFAKQIRYGDRNDPRGICTEIVGVVPWDEQTNSPVIDEAFPCATKDLSSEGIALIVDKPLTSERVVIAFKRTFAIGTVLCDVCHSTEAGFGFWQVGLHPREIVELPPEVVDTLTEKLNQSVPTEEAAAT